MTKAPRGKKPSADPGVTSTFRTEFAGYYPPTEDDLRRFITEGLVVLDTNAVLDLYRFTDPPVKNTSTLCGYWRTASGSRTG